MIDLKRIREHPDEVRASLKRRGDPVSLEEILRIDREIREILKEVEALRARLNAASKEIGRKVAAGGANAVEEAKAEMRSVGDRIRALEEEERGRNASLQKILLTLPNEPDASVPEGRSAEENPVVRTWGTPRAFEVEPHPHWEIGESLGILDFERGAKVAAGGFVAYLGLGARLARALIQFMLDLHATEGGYREVSPPFIVRRESLIGTGQLPKFEAELFKLEGLDWYLVPTAEVPLTNLHAGEILEGSALPIRYAAYTPCFRKEAGSHGAEVRGLIRQHQFDKVELVQIVRAPESMEALERLTNDAERVLQRLDLPYRVVALCSGDLGFSSAKTYDLEVWVPSQKMFREVSSCSNCKDFQARRANLRYRPAPKAKPEFAHTLNGSGLAVGRTVVALLENHQERDGSVRIPEALRPYLGGLDSLRPPRA